jgi:diaminohydroxyphosphoribosylaminopyrimidine deaminase/5-amino-6-(5-phosphoribosylamino)uracil reductase
VIGCPDPSKEVNGKGIEKLIAAGVQVGLASSKMGKECKNLNKRFFTFHTLHRPYIILKWAETADGKIAPPPPKGGILEVADRKRLLISNEQTNRLVHKWRSEEAAILIGANTALYDNPALTTRLWPGPSPIRLVVDLDLKLPASLNIFNDEAPTIIFNKSRHSENMENSFALFQERKVGRGPFYYKLAGEVSRVHQLVIALYQMKIQSVLVEGGARLLQSFIDEGLWDEARIISNKQLTIGNGIAAPPFPRITSSEDITILDDVVNIYLHEKNH